MPVTVIFWFPHSWFTEIWSLLRMAMTLFILCLFISAEFPKDAFFKWYQQVAVKAFKVFVSWILLAWAGGFLNDTRISSSVSNSSPFQERGLHFIIFILEKATMEKNQRFLLMNQRKFYVIWGKMQRKKPFWPFSPLALRVQFLLFSLPILSHSYQVWKGAVF